MSEIVVECCTAPPLDIPVTVTLYEPAGVPVLRALTAPRLPPFPHEATWNIKTTDSMHAKTRSSTLLHLWREAPKLTIPNNGSPVTGSQNPSGVLECLKGCSEAITGLVLMIRVLVAEPLAAGVTAFAEHVGDSAGLGCTEQLKDTALLNPFSEVTVS